MFLLFHNKKYDVVQRNYLIFIIIKTHKLFAHQLFIFISLFSMCVFVFAALLEKTKIKADKIVLVSNYYLNKLDFLNP